MQKHALNVSFRKIFAVYWRIAKSYKGMLALTIIGVVIASTTWIGMQYFFRDFINILSATNAETDRSVLLPQLFTIVYLIIGTRFFGYLARRMRDTTMIFFQTNAMRDLYDYSFNAIHQHGINFFQNNFGGALVKKVNRFVGAFESLSNLVFHYFIILVLEIILILVVFFSIHPYLGLLTALWAVAFFGIVLFLSQKKSSYDVKASIAQSKVSGTLADTIANAFTIKIFASQRKEAAWFHNDNEHARKATKTSWLFDEVISWVQGLMLIAVNFLTLVLFLHIWETGLLQPGDVVLLITTQMNLSGRLWEFGPKIRRAFADGSYAMEMIEILETPQEITNSTNAKQLEVSKGEIKLQNVAFNYEGKKDVLTGLDITIQAGEKVALVGHSGAGKSTITKLLLRFHDLTNGTITIDGQDIAEVTQESLRAQITYVPQEPILFHRSLAENIRYGNMDATMAQVERAASLAHAHTFIKKLPQGYDTLVGERGVKLSGGERQRVAIARAILKNAPIIILDEATSSLDSESEKHIQAALHNLMKGKTAVVIAHRLSTIMEMDRIIVMEEGGIMEQGSHQELLKQEGIYKQLWDIQSGSFLQ